MSRLTSAESHGADAGRIEHVDPVIEAYKKDVDRTLIRHVLQMTVEERLLSLERCLRDAAELRRAGMAATALGSARDGISGRDIGTGPI